MPDVFDRERLKKAGIRTDHLLFYPGIKEQIYLSAGGGRTDLPRRMGIDEGRVIVILRPPGCTGHYRQPASDRVMEAILRHLGLEREKVAVILLPRSSCQKDSVADLLERQSIPYSVPERAVDGIELILNSDLVLSGGGTMSREAAVLGIPAYSFFQGPLGAVDEYLNREKRLTLIRSDSDVESLPVVKRPPDCRVLGKSSHIVGFICDELEKTITSSDTR